MITAIGFDGDDTLWHTETVFASTEEEYWQILEPYAAPAELKQRLFDTEMKNLRLFGYGVKSFVLSMMETALEVSRHSLDARAMQRILDIGISMLEGDVEPIENVEATLAHLALGHQLMLITKGDLFDQESKLAKSGLADLFSAVTIVSDKDPSTYERVLDRNGIAISEFVMVGNSLRSDVLPVIELGGRAIHVPYHRFWQVSSIDRVPSLVERLSAPTG